MNFSRLKEECDGASSADLYSVTPPSNQISPGPPQLTPSTLDRLFSNRNTKIGVICLLTVLIVVLIIDTRVSGATNFDKVVRDLNSSIDFQNELRDEIQTVGEKLNTAVSDIRVMKDNSTFNRLKLMLRPVLESLKTSLKTNISANGRNIDIVLKTAADNERKYSDLMRNLSSISESSSNMEKMIHERIDVVSNQTKDHSISMNDNHENLSQEMDILRHMVENIQEEIEESGFRQEMTNIDTNKRMNLLEMALNMTVTEIQSSKSGHADFANKTMSLLRNVMDIYRNQMEAENSTSAGDNLIDDVTVRENTTTPSSDSIDSTQPDDTCTDPKAVTSNMIRCSASSTYSRKYTCAKAFDGVLQTNRLGSAWASKGEGVGAWIQATFSQEIIIKEIKLLQRFAEAEANRQVDILFDGNIVQSAILPARGSRHWNVIRLSRGVPSSSLKISITEVYGTINNGFKEISVLGCF